MKRLSVLAVAVSMLALPAGGRAAPSTGWGDPIPASVLAQYKARDTGRYIVMLSERADLRAAAAIPVRDARRVAVVEALRRTAERTQAGLLRLLAAARSSGAVSEYRPLWVVNAVAVESNETILRMIAARPEVGSIVPDTRRRLVPTTKTQTQRAIAEATADWNIDKVGAPAAWAAGIDGAGAVVSSIDTGVDWEHPSIASKYRGAAGGTHDFNWWDAINHEAVPYDDNSHGTHTMGTMLGGDGQGPDPDDIGVAPGATWIAAKAFDGGGGGVDSWILEAAQFLTAPTRADGTDPRPELAPDVVNNSWGGGQCDAWFDDVMRTWRAMSIFPAFAIGNSGPGEGSAGSPGDSPEAFGVGATDIDDEIAFFSSRGPSCHEEIKPEVSAPGVSVRSSVPGGGFDFFDGTSMATPHIAGTVALMAQAGGGVATVDDIEDALRATALDLGDPGADNTFGAGRLRAFEAVQIVLRGGTLAGRVTDAGGSPIAGASVVAEVTGGRTGRTKSAADGTYRLRLVDGAYQVTVSAFGYLTRTLPAVIVEGETTTLDFGLELAPRVTVSGVVRESPAGDLLESATVTVLETPLDPVVTNHRGKYAIEIPVGTYEFEVSRGGCLERARVTVAANAALTQDFSLARRLDAFGYVCDEAPFVHEPGTTKLPVQGFDSVAKVTLPFAFPFYGGIWNEVWVHSNGYVSVLDEPTDFTNRPIPDAATPNGAIYALWDDLFVRGAARGVYTATYGSPGSRRFVIEYRNFEVPNTGDLLNFAVVLREDGTFDVRHRSLEGRGTGFSATVGIENLNGSSGIQYLNDEPRLSDGSAIAFRLGPVGYIEGVVTDAVDGLPIDGALLTAGAASVRTGADGRYRLAQFGGTFNVEASAAGWDTASATVTVSEGAVRVQNFALAAPRAVLEPASLTLEAGKDPATGQVTLRNVGARPLEYRLGELDPDEPLKRIITDPEDSDGSIEVTGVRAAARDGSATLRIEFSDGTDVSQVAGYVFLDTDQNPDTGMRPEDLAGKPTQDIGMEYFLSLFDLPTVHIYTKDFDHVAAVTAEIGAHDITVALPLEHLGPDDGAIDVAMVIGDYFEPLDWAPDDGHGSIPITIDLPWLSEAPVEGTLAAGQSQVIDVTANPEGLAARVHRAVILLDSNDPRTPAEAVVTFRVTDVTPPSSFFDAPPANVLVVRALGQRVTGVSLDDASGIAQVRVVFTPLLGGEDVVVTPVLNCGAEPQMCRWEIEPPGIGPYSVTAYATDRAGNEEETRPSTVILAA